MKHCIAAIFALSLAFSAFAQDKKEVKLADLPKNADGAYILFDGKTLAGWDGNPDFWSVQDGCITGTTTKEKPTKGNTFLIFRGGKPADFELKAKFKLDNHNSGIQVRSKDKGNWVMNGYQADIAESRYTGILYEEGGRGILVDVGQKVTIGADGKKTTEKFADAKDIQAAVTLKEWHEYTITAKGNNLVQMIDGKKTMELVDNEEAKRAMDGFIGFQCHAGPPMKVQFKDVTLKVLDAAK